MEPIKEWINCVVIGAKGVGKTELIMKFMQGSGINEDGEYQTVWAHSDI